MHVDIFVKIHVCTYKLMLKSETVGMWQIFVGGSGFVSILRLSNGFLFLSSPCSKGAEAWIHPTLCSQ